MCVLKGSNSVFLLRKKKKGFTFSPLLSLLLSTATSAAMLLVDVTVDADKCGESLTVAELDTALQNTQFNDII